MGDSLLVPKNLFKDAKKLSLIFLRGSISCTPCDFFVVYLCLADLRVSKFKFTIVED